MQKKPINSEFCLCPLASGSKGNAVFVSSPDTAVLVDAGLSGIEVQRRLAAVGRTPDELKAIIITHEHTDHVKGAGVLSRRFNIPVYMTADTFNACKGLGKIDHINFFECGTAFDIGSLAVNPFAVSHDACDPAGLTLKHQGKKIAIATDLGVVTNLVRTHLSCANALYIEANHDPEMLMAGPYPWYLKQRIQSRKGHLSNQNARDLVAQLSHKDLAHVVLAHLSEENNCPEKAATEMSKNLDSMSTMLHVAGPEHPGEMIRL
jgi:phosphoribosyl 1,2-cyclic phosphodiesterase